MFADINCGNDMFWGHLGVQKRGLKKGKLIKKKNHNFLQKKKNKKYSAAYSYSGLEIVSQILTGLK